MTHDILVLVDHQKNAVMESTFEALGVARTIAGLTHGRTIAGIAASGAESMVSALGAADAAFVADDQNLAVAAPDALVGAATGIAARCQASHVIIPGTNAFVGVGAKLARRLQVPFINFCRAVRGEGDAIIATSQLFGGKVLADIEVPPTGAVLSICPGVFPPDAGRKEGTPPVERVTVERVERTAQFLRLIESETGDVDITKQDVLIAVGRGIDTEDNIGMAEELAALLGGAVCGSRPVIDQGWLPLSRQVGKSGMAVRPRLYLALGISGAPEHVEGMRQAGYILSVNRDPNAPIFDVSHAGVCGDMFDVLPALIAALKARKGG